jgi:hypothetical protein
MNATVSIKSNVTIKDTSMRNIKKAEVMTDEA